MGNSPVDRDVSYMKSMWGTNRLVTDYVKEEKMSTENDFLDNLANHQHQKMLREIANDDQTPKKTDSLKETEIFDENEEIMTLKQVNLNEF